VYKKQKNLTFKPVRNLTQKHVFPSNMEKMNAKRSVHMYSPELIAFIEMLMHWEEKSNDVDFTQASATLKFMKMIQKIFKVHDVSESSQHIRQLDPDKAPFTISSDDERLTWLAEDFPDYVRELQSYSHKAGLRGLTEETCEALLLTCNSTVLLVRYLLNEGGFKFVLTRKLASDCVEGIFGAMKQRNSSNPNIDCRSTEGAMRDILRTGIIMAA
jgi:hypothetical protein